MKDERTKCGASRSKERLSMAERKKDKEEKLYSQTELADELEVSQSTITRLIRDSGIKPTKVFGRKKLYSEDQLKILSLSSFERKKDTPQSTDTTGISVFLQKEIQRLHEENERLVERYTDQLQAKDQQIADLNERLSESHKLQLGLENQLKMLPEATSEDKKEEKPVVDDEPKKAPEPEKRGFWSRIFKK